MAASWPTAPSGVCGKPAGTPSGPTSVDGGISITGPATAAQEEILGHVNGLLSELTVKQRDAVLDAAVIWKIEVEEPAEPEATDVIDLMTRLQESLAQGKKRKKGAATEPAKAREEETGETRPKSKGRKRKTA